MKTFQEFMMIVEGMSMKDFKSNRRKPNKIVFNSYYEMLLEEIRDKVQIIAEGHDALNNKMDMIHANLDNKISNLDKKIDMVHASLKDEIKVTAFILKDEIKEVKVKLDEHMRLAHAA